MQRMLIICALLLAGAPDVFGQAANHSAAAQADSSAETRASDSVAHYKYIRAGILDDIRAIYFAVGCKILSEPDATPLIENEAAYMEYEALSIRFLDVEGATLRDKAAHEGLIRASAPGACDYWHQYPAAALAMQRAARVAGQPR